MYKLGSYLCKSLPYLKNALLPHSVKKGPNNCKSNLNMHIHQQPVKQAPQEQNPSTHTHSYIHIHPYTYTHTFSHLRCPRTTTFPLIKLVTPVPFKRYGRIHQHYLSLNQSEVVVWGTASSLSIMSWVHIASDDCKHCMIQPQLKKKPAYFIQHFTVPTSANNPYYKK